MTPDVRPDDGFGARNRFLTETPPGVPRRRERSVGGLTASLGAHVAALLIATIVVSRSPMSPSDGSTNLITRTPLVYGGGGGGGGREQEAQPARRAQLVGRDSVALPSVQPTRIDYRAATEPVEHTQRLAVPDRQVNAGLQEMVGAVSAVANPDFGTRGPGSGPGADGGRGPGTGPGAGPGLGPGDGPGSGDDGQYPGNGVSWPKLIVELKPNYTAEAMRARVEGIVELEIVVHADGTVGRIRITRSLDPRFGLDNEAIKAVRGWRFDPARQAGTPVQVRVPVEVSFRLR